MLVFLFRPFGACVKNDNCPGIIRIFGVATTFAWNKQEESRVFKYVCVYYRIQMPRIKESREDDQITCWTNPQSPTPSFGGRGALHLPVVDFVTFQKWLLLLLSIGFKKRTAASKAILPATLLLPRRNFQVLCRTTVFVL